MMHSPDSLSISHEPSLRSASTSHCLFEASRVCLSINSSSVTPNLCEMAAMSCPVRRTSPRIRQHAPHLLHVNAFSGIDLSGASLRDALSGAVVMAEHDSAVRPVCKHCAQTTLAAPEADGCAGHMSSGLLNRCFARPRKWLKPNQTCRSEMHIADVRCAWAAGRGGLD